MHIRQTHAHRKTHIYHVKLSSCFIENFITFEENIYKNNKMWVHPIGQVSINSDKYPLIVTNFL